MKKYRWLAFLFLLFALSLIGCSPSAVPPDALASSDTMPPQTVTETVPEETTVDHDAVERLYRKKKTAAKLDEDFADNQALVILYPRFNDATYTPQTFGQVGCVGVLDLSVDLIPNAPQRMLCLLLPEHSKEGVLSALRLLEERDDVYRAEPNRYLDIDAMLVSSIAPMLGDASALSPETEAEMKVAYVETVCKAYNDSVRDKYPDDVVTPDRIRFVFYGAFHGVYAVCTSGTPFDYAQVLVTDTVDGLPFFYGSGHTMDIYCNGTFYKVKEAFEEGILTHEDLVMLLHNYTIKRRLIGPLSSQGW